MDTGTKLQQPYRPGSGSCKLSKIPDDLGSSTPVISEEAISEAVSEAAIDKRPVPEVMVEVEEDLAGKEDDEQEAIQQELFDISGR